MKKLNYIDRKNAFILLFIFVFFFFFAIKFVSAYYVTDIYFTVPDTMFVTNERIEIKGYVYQANYSANGTLSSASSYISGNLTTLANASVNFTMRHLNGTTVRTQNFTTDANGIFYSRGKYWYLWIFRQGRAVFKCYYRC